MTRLTAALVSTACRPLVWLLDRWDEALCKRNDLGGGDE